MSTIRTFPGHAGDIEVVTDADTGTITFVSSRDADDTIPPTEWMTVDADTVVDLDSYR
ncbi:hypothetical protein [Halovenus sp. HT40]|uniref:hypothetical protein n=1 Tax=Halovenus sp. HT40 TaxID=3126691 RepID=UPI00300F26C6